MSFRFCNFAPMRRINYLLVLIVLLVAGCSSKGEYTRKVESKLELMERHLSEGERAEAKEVLQEINVIVAGAGLELMGVISEIGSLLSDVDEDCPQSRQIRDELSNMGDAASIKAGFGSSGSASLSEIIAMELGDRAKEEWKKAKKDLIESAKVIDKTIAKAKKLRNKAEKAKKECKQS